MRDSTDVYVVGGALNVAESAVSVYVGVDCVKLALLAVHPASAYVYVIAGDIFE